MTRRRTLTLAVAAVVLVSLLAWALARTGSAPETRAEAHAAPRARLPEGVPGEVGTLLQQGRSWRAAQVMRDVVARDSSPDVVLLAARAEAGWGGWRSVRRLLEGKPWLDRAGSGIGWFWLGRAREEAGDRTGAADAYARYLRATPRDTAGAGVRAVAELRHALVLLRAGRAEEGAAALEELRTRGAAGGWPALLAAEALAPSGDTARVRRLVASAAGSVPPERAAAALADAYVRARDGRTGRALALAQARDAVAGEERAGVLAAAGRAALAAGDTAAALADWRGALAAAQASPGAFDAAARMESLPGLTPADHLALAGVFAARGAAARAVPHYRAWLASAAGTPPQRADVSYSLGRALFVSGRYGEAATTLAPLADDPAPLGPRAAYLLGRAQARGAPGSARATLLRLAERYPNAPEAADALFVAGDLAQDARDEATAFALFRRVVAAHPSHWRAGQAAARVGGRALLRGDAAGAAHLWDGLRAATADPEIRAQAAYWAGRAHLAAGDAAGARERFAQAREAAPLSYYAVLAARRLGASYWPVKLVPAPAADTQIGRRVEESLRAADLLREAGLFADAEAEVDRVTRRAGEDRATLYALAEAVASRGYTVPALHIGRVMEARGEPQNERLLRIIYPLNYRPALEAEARDHGLDPFLVAALTRQESVFKPRAQSPAGARGLMQIMPGTGRGLAAGAGIRDWSPELLYDPEINLHLGTRYLAAQMRAYGGSLPSVFTAYNAGPARVTRWRSFPEYHDAELFTERIPFDETREYVKILTRNIALYRGLYGS
jgi:soluble lytic murein transglycosylase